MSFTLLLNSANVVGSNNNTYQYKFVNGNFKIPEGSEMAISQATIPYSWYNITASYANNTFSLRWVNTGASTTSFTIPDGFYTVSDLNAYIQRICITNGWYLIDSSGNNVYYINLSTNTNYYKVQLLLLLVPTSLPAGYTAPSNWPGYPATATAPFFLVTNNGSIGSVIGIKTGVGWGGSTVNVSVLSTSVPNLTPVNSLTMRCSLVNNGVATPSDILDAIPIDTTFGSNINYAPNYEKWVKISSGTFNNFTITLSDQNLNQLYALDPNVSITLLIRTPK